MGSEQHTYIHDSLVSIPNSYFHFFKSKSIMIYFIRLCMCTGRAITANFVARLMFSFAGYTWCGKTPSRHFYLLVHQKLSWMVTINSRQGCQLSRFILTFQTKVSNVKIQNWTSFVSEKENGILFEILLAVKQKAHVWRFHKAHMYPAIFQNQNKFFRISISK
jgi:hypothetical protein